MRTFYNKSRATGTCKTCGATINKGTPAWWSQSAGWQCTECNGSGDQPTPKAEAPAKQEPPKSSGLPPVRMTESGGRVDIEFGRLLEAAESAAAFGKGNNTEPTFLDSSIKSNERKEFLSRRTVPGLIRMIKDGNPEMTQLVEQLREEISSDTVLPTEDRRRVRRGRDCGDEIEVDRFLNRIPEMWSRIEGDQVPARRIVITINGSVSYKQKQDELGYRAAAAIALADKLTELGASVEVRLMICTTNNPTSEVREYVASVVVKQSDQPMSIPDLATACCDIGAFRLAMVYGTTRHLRGTVRMGLGTPQAIPADRQIGDFIADRDITNRTQAVQWVQDSINKFSNSNSEVAHV